jgi:hypothetical protein
MQLVSRKYKFVIETRQVALFADYREVEYKQARVFMKNIKASDHIIIGSESRIEGRSQNAFIQYRFGMEDPKTTNDDGDEVSVADSITAYVPIDQMHYGQWAKYRITGKVEKDQRYSGMEIGGIHRRANSNMILATTPKEETAHYW